MFKYYLISLFAAYSFSAIGQVGIGTVTPQADLHILGDVQITEGIRLGGDASTPGSLGTNGQIIISDGTQAQWQDPTKALSGFFIAVIVAHLQNNFDDATQNFVMEAGDNLAGNLIEDYDRNDAFNPTTGEFTVAESGLFRLRLSLNYTTNNGSLLSVNGLDATPYMILGIWNNTDSKAEAEFYVTPDYLYEFSTTDAGVARVFETFVTLSTGKTYLFNMGAVIREVDFTGGQRFRFLADDGSFNAADNPTSYILLEKLNN